MKNLFKSQDSLSTISTPLNNTKGFSLGEIMIVLVIIGGIMAIVLPKIQDGQKKSQVNNTKMKMTEITTKISEYYAECSKYPTTLAFITDDDASCKNWTSNPKLKHLLKDAWGSDFQYGTAGNGYNLSSLGADKKAGGTSFDKDLYSDESVGSEE
ncbi:type II secretion system protein GspG [Bdellovibrio sp. qaytius]|nr:type II secretion system protein GspG [Bdellovibrio sp. qaytius]